MSNVLNGVIPHSIAVYRSTSADQAMGTRSRDRSLDLEAGIGDHVLPRGHGRNHQHLRAVAQGRA